jgi:hypothetical protein
MIFLLTRSLPAYPPNLPRTLGVKHSTLRSVMDRDLTQITYCFYVDDDGQIYFCVGDFCREHRLPDSPELRRAVAEDIKATFPGILILEEQS